MINVKCLHAFLAFLCLCLSVPFTEKRKFTQTCHAHTLKTRYEGAKAYRLEVEMCMIIAFNRRATEEAMDRRFRRVTSVRKERPIPFCVGVTLSKPRIVDCSIPADYVVMSEQNIYVKSCLNRIYIHIYIYTYIYIYIYIHIHICKRSSEQNIYVKEAPNEIYIKSLNSINKCKPNINKKRIFCRNITP